jgi:hypothetical protein
VSDTADEILDIASWVLGGVLCGLLLLGGYNFYQALQVPQHPQLSLTPVSKDDVKPVQRNPNFRSPDQLQLVKRLSPETEEKTTPDTPTNQNTPPSETVSSKSIQETELPYRLLGTTTGLDGYEMAIIRNLKEQKTRTLTLNDEWNELTIVEINDDDVRIVNGRTGVREKLTLNPTSNER